MIVPPRRGMVGIVATLLFVAACKRQPTVDDERTTLVSWAGTVRHSTHAWLDHDVTTTYARVTIDHARDELVAERKNIAKLPPSRARADLHGALATFDTVLDSLLRQIRGGDVAATRRHLEALARLHDTLQLMQSRGASTR